MTTPTFKLIVDGIELTLVEFDGVEEMNRLFKYTFKTEIPSTGEKLADIIDGDAVFTIEEFDTSLYTGNIEIPGYISKASKTSNDWILEFQPKLKKTTTNSRSEIYFTEAASLDAKDVIELEFDHDISLNDRTPVYDITSTLPTRKLFCQFHESNFNFVARLCDHWGFQFYFDHYNSQIVFADNNQYDQKITTQLKTTSTTADNSPLKILNWQENLVPTESYTTVFGYDHENAGTEITSSYPADAASQTGLTESRKTLSDLNSQDEADYIAQVRQEANNCLNHQATGEAKIPYLMPGFLINTDDSDFSQALVIKTTNTARNLNSTNSGTAAHFICEFQAIPSSVCFRPTPSYRIPTATNIIGKVISETDDITQAQRNTNGQYKAELLGFENQSSVHPWLRKAQTTAANNSVDVPLTPNTEVLISFIDNNPNCPYIQHALNNSLFPAPVTNANPNQAVISTHGMLVTSSLEGRYNYAITGPTLEAGNTYATSDANISSTIKNYFTERGEFDQNSNFIDPTSTTAMEFSDNDEGGGDYLFTRFSGDSVEIRQGDKMHWHNGNIYDFGGYWNYNLGNSYEENFIDQGAPLNTKVNKDSRTGDILTSGPNPGPISFTTLKQGGLDDSDVIPASYSNTGVVTTSGSNTFAVNSEGSWNANGMNITKDYNATYDYKFGESIEISDRVNSLEITHNDDASTEIEMAFHNGVLRSWEKVVARKKYEKSWNGSGTLTSDASSVSGVAEETNWHSKGSNHKSSWSKTTKNDSDIKTEEKTYSISSGSLAKESVTTSDGAVDTVTETTHATCQTDKISFDFGRTNTLSISAQGSSSLAISFSGSASIAVGFGLAVEIKTGVESGIDLDLRAGIKLEIDKGKLKFNTIGLQASLEAAVEAKEKKLELENAKLKLENTLLDIGKTIVELDQANVKLDTSYLIVQA